MKTASQVVSAIVDAKTTGKKAKATRFLNEYVRQQDQLGHEPTRTVAAIKAVITRHFDARHNDVI